MSLGTNLQFLRKRQGMTQEEFAERLDISRQTISKWESDASFPEMEKLLILCDLFGCDLDTLLRGDAAEAIADDTAGYDRHMNGFTMAICWGAFLVLMGVAVFILMVALSVSHELGVMVFLTFILIAAAVFIVSGLRHGDFVRKHSQIKPFYRQEQIDAFERRFPFFIAVPTVLILLGVIALMGCEVFPRPEWMAAEQFESLFLAAFLALIAFSAPVYIYGGMQKSKYNIPEYNQENAPTQENQRRSRLKGTACGVIMMLATAAYLVMGLGFDLWSAAAIPFAVGGLFCGIASIIVDGVVKRENV